MKHVSLSRSILLHVNVSSSTCVENDVACVSSELSSLSLTSLFSHHFSGLGNFGFRVVISGRSLASLSFFHAVLAVANPFANHVFCIVFRRFPQELAVSLCCVSMWIPFYLCCVKSIGLSLALQGSPQPISLQMFLTSALFLPLCTVL